MCCLFIHPHQQRGGRGARVARHSADQTHTAAAVNRQRRGEPLSLVVGGGRGMRVTAAPSDSHTLQIHTQCAVCADLLSGSYSLGLAGAWGSPIQAARTPRWAPHTRICKHHPTLSFAMLLSHTSTLRLRSPPFPFLQLGYAAQMPRLR